MAGRSAERSMEAESRNSQPLLQVRLSMVAKMLSCLRSRRSSARTTLLCVLSCRDALEAFPDLTMTARAA